MTKIIYGVWDGKVHNSGDAATMTTLPDLKNFDDFDDGNGIRAFFGEALDDVEVALPGGQGQG